MISDARLARLNDLPIASDGRYVLYWMQASQRTRWNHALEYAIRQANGLRQPLVVGFGLMDDYPAANARHYSFMLEGLRDVESVLRERGIKFIVRRGQPAQMAVALGAEASLIVCDRGYTRHQKAWRDHVADHAGRRVMEVETDVIVPVEAASQKQEFGARTIRPRLHRHWATYVVPLGETTVNHPSLRLKLTSDVDLSDTEAALATLKVDRSVPISRHFVGGQNAASTRLQQFLAEKLDGYADGRNEPVNGQSSTLSPYLQFGQISPLEMAICAAGALTGGVLRAGRHPPVGAPAALDRDSFLEELGIRRELAVNFINYCPNYDQYECLPMWAKKTLSEHRGDRRQYLYTSDQLQAAATHDPYWNAAQREMNVTGFMHNYMRMYWGKKVIEWSRSPEDAYATLLHLNNKFFLDGRGPNAFANVGWIFGLHDRAWGPERPIFGKVRYMNAAGLERKFDIQAYVKKIAEL